VDAIDRFVETFNRGEVPPLSELTAPDYSYAEPMAPTLVDAAGHAALMAGALQNFPDRRFEVRRRVSGPQGALVEGIWSGTPAGGGDQLVLDAVFVFDLDQSTGKIARCRGYYDFPSP
jgi:hypothetical protein